MMSAALVEWARSVTFADLPESVRRAVGRHLLDGVGNAIAAKRLGYGRASWMVAHTLGGPGEARALTGSTAISAPAAAMATATLVHALDFDDTHAGALVHATAVSLPAAFAVGQHTNASGGDVLAATAVGLETACRLGAASPHGFHARGLHATAVVGPLTAALVTGYLTKANATEMVHALGIAGSSSGGLLEFLDTDADTKALHPGSASFNGIIAARLAAAGASGPTSVLEGARGVYATLSDRPAILSELTDGLGSRWEATRIGIKPYPSCQLMHVTLDAAMQALSDGPVYPAAVDKIEVHVHPDSIPIVCGANAGVEQPRSTYDGKFDLPWSVAALIHDGHLDVSTYTQTSITRESVLATARKVVVVEKADGGPAASASGQVVITLDDGRALTGTVAGSRGSAALPLTDRQLLDKFLGNCGGHPRAIELSERVLGLSDEPDLSGVLELAALIAPEPH